MSQLQNVLAKKCPKPQKVLPVKLSKYKTPQASKCPKSKTSQASNVPSCYGKYRLFINKDGKFCDLGMRKIIK